MRIISRTTLSDFARVHPETRTSLDRWEEALARGAFRSTQDVTRGFSKAKVLNAQRARFEVQGGNYRLIAAFDFRRQIVYIKFIGTHAEYDRVDALTVSNH